MSRDVWLTQLRIAGSDAAAVKRLIAAGVPDDALQHAGQAIVRCSPNDRVSALIKPLIDQLDRRDWTGDAELIVELEHVGAGTSSELKVLAVDLDEIGEALDESPASESYIDLDTATLWPGQLFDVGEEPDDFDPDDTGRWLLIAELGSAAAYRMMERFISTIDRPGLVERLSEAIRGSGAFRRFNDELSRHDEEYSRWHRFRNDARLGNARAWLADHGYRSTR